MHRTRRASRAALGALLFLGGCGSPGVAGEDAGEVAGEDAGLEDGSTDDDGGGPRTLEGGAPPVELVILQVRPDHGPFDGSVEVIVRATPIDPVAWADGCAPCGVVTFDGVAASGVRPIDDRRLLVAPPAHSPGLVDVGLVQHGERATLAGAYTYDPVVVAPREGPSEGGTPVTVRTAGPSLAAGDEVRFGGSPCTDLVVEAPDRATCLTPPGPVGNVDVEVVHASGALERAVRGFTYRLVAP